MFSDNSDNEEVQVPEIAFGDWTPPLRPRDDDVYDARLNAEGRWRQHETRTRRNRLAALRRQHGADIDTLPWLLGESAYAQIYGVQPQAPVAASRDLAPAPIDADLVVDDVDSRTPARPAHREEDPEVAGLADLMLRAVVRQEDEYDVIGAIVPEGGEHAQLVVLGIAQMRPQPAPESSTSGEERYEDASAAFNDSDTSGVDAYEDAREKMEVVAPSRASKRPATPPVAVDEPPVKSLKVDANQGAEARREQQVGFDDEEEETTSSLGDALKADVPEVHQRKRRAAGDDSEVSAGGKRARVEPQPEAFVDQPLQLEVFVQPEQQEQPEAFVDQPLQLEVFVQPEQQEQPEAFVDLPLQEEGPPVADEPIEPIVIGPTQSTSAQPVEQANFGRRLRRVFPPPVWERRGTRVVRTVEFFGADDDADDDMVGGDATATACSVGLRQAENFLKNATTLLTGDVVVGLQQLHRVHDDAAVVTRLRTTLRRLATKHEQEGVDVEVVRTAINKVARRLVGSPVDF